MLLLTSLQGWGMVGIIAVEEESQAALLHELKRLHNLGLTGGLLAIASGLALMVQSVEPGRQRTIGRVLLPSLLIAPIGFCDRALIVVAGPIPGALQGCFYALQAASALGITVGLVLLVQTSFRREGPKP